MEDINGMTTTTKDREHELEFPPPLALASDKVANATASMYALYQETRCKIVAIDMLKNYSIKGMSATTNITDEIMAVWCECVIM